METIIIVAIVIGIACGLMGGQILSDKGRDPLFGFAIGLLLGIVGVVLTVAMDPSYEVQLARHKALTRAAGGSEAPTQYGASPPPVEGLSSRHPPWRGRLAGRASRLMTEREVQELRERRLHERR